MMKIIKYIALLLSVFSLAMVQNTTSHAAPWGYENIQNGQVRIYATSMQGEVQAAANYWNTLAGQSVVSVVSSPDSASVILEVKSTFAGDTNSNLGLTTAYLDNAVGLMTIFPDRATTYGISQVDNIAHEIGHSLNLSHDESSQLMRTVNGFQSHNQHEYQLLKEALALHGVLLNNAEFEGSKSAISANTQPENNISSEDSTVTTIDEQVETDEPTTDHSSDELSDESDKVIPSDNARAIIDSHQKIDHPTGFVPFRDSKV